MAGFSDYLENLVLNWLSGDAMPSAPTVYVGLFSATPNDAGGGTEVTTTIRTAGRVAASFGAASSGQIVTDALVDFGASAGNATVTHFGLFDASSAGHLLAYGPLTASLAITTGISVSFAIGDLSVALD